MNIYGDSHWRDIEKTLITGIILKGFDRTIVGDRVINPYSPVSPTD